MIDMESTLNLLGMRRVASGLLVVLALKAKYHLKICLGCLWVEMTFLASVTNLN